MNHIDELKDNLAKAVEHFEAGQKTAFGVIKDPESRRRINTIFRKLENGMANADTADMDELYKLFQDGAKINPVL